MIITPGIIEGLIFNTYNHKLRYTQDSPIYPDVWMDFYNGRNLMPDYRADLILTPHRSASASELFQVLSERLDNKEAVPKTDSERRMATNGETVVASLTFEELIRVALPLTKWWQHYLWQDQKSTEHLEWLMTLVGAFYYAADSGMLQREHSFPEALAIFGAMARDHFNFEPGLKSAPLVLWSVSRNRKATLTIEKSVPCTKADSSRRLFDIDGSGIAWAVMDTGIDARHPAFRTIDPTTGQACGEAFGAKEDPHSNHTRIVATYDFSRFREILSRIHICGDNPELVQHLISTLGTSTSEDKSMSAKEVADLVRETERDLRGGRQLDWTVLAPVLRVPHNQTEYQPPKNSHGTHVAGILGAGLSKELSAQQMMGMCPRIGLYDIRVLDEAGSGDEFNILAAIQFVRWLNSQKDTLVVHGANMSFSMTHEVAAYACGQTPVCVACERMISDGMVVVTVAGNQGQAIFTDKTAGSMQGFRMVNITDPGNAENVITVGSTHRDSPYNYGVSYFSSRGPTGDGRVKPDLVAPGEKIVSLVIDGKTDRMDGTSMAAPHVSGAAALLLSKHRELIGKPKRVKEVLCQTATDLGREKYFQGYGLIDVLRAIQSV